MLINKTFGEFFEERLLAQEEYARKFNNPTPDEANRDETHSLVLSYLDHLIEEAVEARQHIPRKFWKKEPSYLESESSKEEFSKELCDILLFLFSAMTYSGISKEDLFKHFDNKINYNTYRKDHQ